ncbi:MAG: dTDP-glucose 4,6-dehydratase [bacterium ADurb.Bin374]|nr:MAG: dTDP-glucose 4,6-dehydratase [bacterium ADurb.Bin374]
MVPAFISQVLRNEPLTLFGDGSQTRSFCYVSDLVEGMMAVMERGDQFPTNLGNPIELTIKEFAERILAISGSSLPIVSKPLPVDDPRRRRPDITRAKTMLGWEPKVNLDEGLRRTIEWARGAKLP